MRKRILAIVLSIAMVLSFMPFSAFAEDTATASTTQEVVFNLGTNGTASHYDGSSKTSYTEPNGTYELSVTNGTNFYTGARDEKGNSCFKLGASSSSKTGSFEFIVPDDVVKVIIEVAKYKAKTTKVNVNGTESTITTSSNDGSYTAIEVDTTTTKTVSFTTVSGSQRAMVNTITYVVELSGAACEHEYDNACDVDCNLCGITRSIEHDYEETVRVDATCSVEGSVTYTCSVCGDTYDEAIATIEHNMVAGDVVDPTETEQGYTIYECSVCGATENRDFTAPAGPSLPEGATAVEFTFGENGTAAHVDGSKLTDTSEAYVSGDYSLKIDSPVNVFGDAKDLTGNSAIKLGTSGSTASFSFTVPDDVAEVWIYAAQYKANSSTLKINETDYVLATASDNGIYTAIKVNTAENKTVTVATVSGKNRAMIDKIVYIVMPTECAHSYESVTTDATCTEAGKTVNTCSKCGESYEEPIAATGHTEVIDAAVAATCTETGLTEGKHCSVCGEVLVAQSVVGILGHSYESTVTTVPTTTTKGEKTYTCANCGDFYTEEMDVLPQPIVENLGATTTTVDSYYIYNLMNAGLSTASGGFNMQMTMDFTAPEANEDGTFGSYEDYYTDFFIEMNGLSADKVSANGCYLAGYYATFGSWVVIPLDGFEIENGFAYPVISIAGFNFTYEMICKDVKNFKCGIYLSDEFLATNPNVEVTLDLGLTEEPVTDLTVEAPFYTVEGYTYDEEDLSTPEVAEVNGIKFYDLQQAVDYADNDDTVVLLGNAEGAGVVINKSITIDFGGYTYSITEPVGSTGTVSNGFQILKDNTVTLKNGTLKVADESADKFFMLIQNYADLTVTDMVLDGTNLDKWVSTYGDSYVISVNSGNVIVNGETNIIANNDGDLAYAFDSCEFSSYAIPTVTIDTTGTISGYIYAVGGNIVLNAGTLSGELIYESGSVTKSDAVALEAPEAYEWVDGVLTLKHVCEFEAVVTAPTETEVGYTTYTCSCGDSYVQDYTAPTKAKVNNVVATVDDDTIRITWDAYEHASDYIVYLYDKDGNTIKRAGKTGTSAAFGGIEAGEYTVQVIARIGTYFKKANADTVAVTVEDDTILGTVQGVANDSAVITWDAVDGAVSYVIRVVGNGTTMHRGTTGTSVRVYGLEANTEYTVYIYVQLESGSIPYTELTTFTTAKETVVTGIAKNVTGSSATISWNAVEGATSYVVRLVGNDGKVHRGTTRNSTTVYGLEAGTEYTVYVYVELESGSIGYTEVTTFTTVS